MKALSLVALALALGALAASAACGEDEAIVRERLDSGVVTAGDGGDASTCGLVLSSTYDSPTFETNAAEELGLRKALDDFLAPMRAVEAQAAADAGAPTGPSKAMLEGLYATGTTSVKTASTPYYQAKVAT